MAVIRLARVLHKDDDFITLEVVLNPERLLEVEEGDQFFSLIFVHSVPDEETHRIKMVDWDPFGKDADGRVDT